MAQPRGQKPAGKPPAARAAAKAPSKSARPSRTPKTTPTRVAVEAFLATLDAAVQRDCRKLDAWMRAATGSAGVMYGKQIAGYGTVTLRYADGREAPWLRLGFSPRAQGLTLYGVSPDPSVSALLSTLGPHSTGKACLYVKRLADVDEAVLRALLFAVARAP